MTIKRPEFAHSSSLMHKLRLTLSLGLLSSVLALGANAQSEPAARWLDPAQDMQNLPRDAGILFWSGDQQIAGFRNITLLSPVRHINRGEQVKALPAAPRDLSSVSYTVAGQDYSLQDFMQQNHVAGLLVLKNGEIAHEAYGLGNREDHLWVSFSMTKSVVSMLTGAAIASALTLSVRNLVGWAIVAFKLKLPLLRR